MSSMDIQCLCRNTGMLFRGVQNYAYDCLYLVSSNWKCVQFV